MSPQLKEKYSQCSQKSGSVEIKVPEGRLIVYQHLRAPCIEGFIYHLCRQISIPVNVGSLVKKLVKELKSPDPSDLSEIRVELSVQGYFTYDDAAQLASHYIPLDQLPNGVQIRRMIRFTRYIARIDAIIEDIEKRKIFGGEIHMAAKWLHWRSIIWQNSSTALDSVWAAG